MRGRKRNLDREGTMRAVYESGATLQEIGDAYGLTRERVRQIIRRGGCEVRHRGPRSDPLAMASALRRATSFVEAAQMSGSDDSTLNLFAQRLGIHAALKRLYRMRRKRHAIDALRSLGARLGRAPTAKEMNPVNGTMSFTRYQQLFGSVARAQQLAGLEPRGIGKKTRSTIHTRVLSAQGA